MTIQTILLSTLAGAIIGGIFRNFKLPLPAPPTLAGVIGVLGVLVGSLIAQYII